MLPRVAPLARPSRTNRASSSFTAMVPPHSDSRCRNRVIQFPCDCAHDLDRLLEELATTPEAAPPELHEGEHLFATERLVVSPCAGVFTPIKDLAVGGAVSAGQLLGKIGNEEVRSPFGGMLMGWLALDSERVTSSQPIAWLQVA